MSNAEVLHQVEHGYRMPCPPNCPAELYNIMLECWNKDALKRPTFETLQWKLEDFFTMDNSEYKEASAYWARPSLPPHRHAHAHHVSVSLCCLLLSFYPIIYHDSWPNATFSKKILKHWNNVKIQQILELLHKYIF